MSRKPALYVVATVLSCVLVPAAGSALRARQDAPKAARTKRAPELHEEEWKKSEAAVSKMLDDFDLTPHPLPPIPDDPPPHEGAMINYPIVIQPPDLVLVEVLEALPGRPISGERMVRPDGTLHLGFYGNVHVAGLTPEQAKVKILKHLRRFLTDDTLGLIDMAPLSQEEPARFPAIPPLPEENPRPTRTSPRLRRPVPRSDA